MHCYESITSGLKNIKKGIRKGYPKLRKGSGLIMKKTLVALAVAGISTSALAAGNIYDNGTTSFNLKGEIDTYVSTVEGKENGKTV
ncbi:porin, partial [Vibrio parahaemolyticus]